jgi:hypothetical protein
MVIVIIILVGVWVGVIVWVGLRVDVIVWVGVRVDVIVWVGVRVDVIVWVGVRVDVIVWVGVRVDVIELLPFTISPLLSLLFLLYSSFFRFLLGLSSFGSVFTKTREKERDKVPQERKNMREKAVLRN